MDTLENKITIVENKITELNKILVELKKEKNEIDRMKKHMRDNELAKQFYDDIVKNGGVKVGDAPSEFDHFIGYSYDIYSFLYPLTSSNNMSIINAIAPRTHQEQIFYPYVVEYMKDKLPMKINIEPEDYGYKNETFATSDSNVRFCNDNPSIILYYIKPR